MKTVYFGTESLSYLGSKLWNLLHQDLKTLTSLTQFKSQVKKMGSAKLPLPTLQVILLECWLYLIQNDFIFMQFICVSFLFFFNQIIFNSSFNCLFFGPASARSYKIGVVGNWLVGNAVFSETALRIFLIFCMKLGDYKGRKVTEPDF